MVHYFMLRYPLKQTRVDDNEHPSDDDQISCESALGDEGHEEPDYSGGENDELSSAEESSLSEDDDSEMAESDAFQLAEEAGRRAAEDGTPLPKREPKQKKLEEYIHAMIGDVKPEVMFRLMSGPDSGNMFTFLTAQMSAKAG